MGFDSPLAFTGVQHQVLVVLGADRELVLCRVEDVEQQVTLSGAVERDRQTECGVNVEVALCTQQNVNRLSSDQISSSTQNFSSTH